MDNSCTMFSLSKLRSSPIKQFSFQTWKKSFGSWPLQQIKAIIVKWWILDSTKKRWSGGKVQEKDKKFVMKYRDEMEQKESTEKREKGSSDPKEEYCDEDKIVVMSWLRSVWRAGLSMMRLQHLLALVNHLYRHLCMQFIIVVDSNIYLFIPPHLSTYSYAIHMFRQNTNKLNWMEYPTMLTLECRRLYATRLWARHHCICPQAQRISLGRWVRPPIITWCKSVPLVKVNRSMRR